MTVKTKTHFNRSEIDDVLESAIEWQERARQNHGITLDVKDCVNHVVMFGCASALAGIDKSFNEILKLAKQDLSK